MNTYWPNKEKLLNIWSQPKVEWAALTGTELPITENTALIGTKKIPITENTLKSGWVTHKLCCKGDSAQGCIKWSLKSLPNLEFHNF